MSYEAGGTLIQVVAFDPAWRIHPGMEFSESLILDVVAVKGLLSWKSWHDCTMAWCKVVQLAAGACELSEWSDAEKCCEFDNFGQKG